MYRPYKLFSKRPFTINAAIRFIAALLLLQGIQAHLHPNADHPSSHGHASHIEVHLTGTLIPVSSQDETAGLDIPILGVIKNLSIGWLFLTIPIVLLMLISLQQQHYRWRYDEKIPIKRLRYTLKPPLRAPPCSR